MASNKRTKEIRQALEGLWKQASLKGWCWGPKVLLNRFSGNVLVLERRGEVVTVSDRDGQVIIHEFRQVKGTKLGEEARDVLLKAGLLSIEGKEAFSMSEGSYAWVCRVCKQRGEVDPTGIEDPRVLANKLYEAHRKAAKEAGFPQLHDERVQILDPQMRECKDLQELVALQGVSCHK